MFLGMVPWTPPTMAMCKPLPTPSPLPTHPPRGASCEGYFWEVGLQALRHREDTLADPLPSSSIDHEPRPNPARRGSARGRVADQNPCFPPHPPPHLLCPPRTLFRTGPVLIYPFPPHPPKTPVFIGRVHFQKALVHFQIQKTPMFIGSVHFDRFVHTIRTLLNI